MNVRELMAKLSRLDPELPVVIDQEDLDLVGQYVEVMNVEFSDDDVCFADTDYSMDRSRPYTRPDWGLHGLKGRRCEPVVLLSCTVPRRLTVDGEVGQAALPARFWGQP